LLRGKKNQKDTIYPGKNLRDQSVKPYILRPCSTPESSYSTEDYFTKFKVRCDFFKKKTVRGKTLCQDDDDDDEDSSSLTSLDWKCKQISIKNAVMMLNEMFPPPLVKFQSLIYKSLIFLSPI